MELSQIPNHATLLAPTHMHGILRNQMLKDVPGRIGIQFCSMDAFFAKALTEEPIEELLVLLQYRQLLSTMDLEIYAKIAMKLDFLQQCAHMIKDMKFYHIEVTALPNLTQAQKEMQFILTRLYPVKDSQDQQNQTLELLSTKSFDHVYLYDFYHDEKRQQLATWLMKRGAHQITLPHVLHSKHFYHAINKRKEIEAVAQNIILEQQNASDINLFVCDDSYKPLIQHIFHRYHIPLTILKQQKTSILVQRFLVLLEYTLNPTNDILLKLLDTNVFTSPYLPDFIDYIQLYHPNIQNPFNTAKTNALPCEMIDEKEIKRLLLLEERANLCREDILPSLLSLHQASEVKEILQRVDRIATLNIKDQDFLHTQTLQQIHENLVVLEPYMKDKEDLIFVMEVLEEIKEQANDKSLHGVLVSDLNATLPPRKVNFFVGCTQTSFPAVPLKKGLFDEAYLANIIDYPTRKLRYDLHMHQILHFLQTSEHLLASYPLGGYDGKGNEVALEMESFMKMSASTYPLIETFLPSIRNVTIDQETAKQLFVKNGVIAGSISSLERYQSCPFSYFLKYGLHIHEPINYEFSPNRIGTLSHYMLEKLIEAYGKSYVDATIQDIEDIITNELDAMANIYPSFNAQVAITKQRLLKSIMKNMEYLKDMEEHSHINPFKSEHEFWWEMKLDDSFALKLHGFIDRIDASSGFLRILDYKSSSKSLSTQDVFAGLQLQLITYSLIAKKEFQKDVLGTYYYSLKNENISIAAGKMKRRPVQYLPFHNEDYYQQWLASKKLTGWTMSEDVDTLDDEGSHIYGLRQNKDGEIKARSVYDIKVLAEHFQTMYKKIGTSILDGYIACAPTEDACMFCPYAEICRFHEYPRTKTLLVEVDDSIYKGGANADANME